MPMLIRGLFVSRSDADQWTGRFGTTLRYNFVEMENQVFVPPIVLYVQNNLFYHVMLSFSWVSLVFTTELSRDSLVVQQKRIQPHPGSLSAISDILITQLRLGSRVEHSLFWTISHGFGWYPRSNWVRDSTQDQVVYTVLVQWFNKNGWLKRLVRRRRAL
jgi:hypothetical protein